jgi:uncharacterized protein
LHRNKFDLERIENEQAYCRPDGGMRIAVTPDIQISASDGVSFNPAPIRPGDILAGQPVARNSLLFKSADRLQYTLLWHCTAGSFRWHYDEDETIMVLEGGMVLHFDDGSMRSCGRGDVVFFPAGTSCVWVIEQEVKKLALFRTPVPFLFTLPLRLARRVPQGRFGRSVRERLRRRHKIATAGLAVGAGYAAYWATF